MDFILESIRGLQEFPLFFNIIIFVFGLCLGSFLNVCIYRLPDEEKSVVRPGSYCPECEKSIAWYDNIPVLSYCLLRARCRHCKTAISIRYPLVELTVGMLSVFCVSYFSNIPQALFLFYLLCSLFVASVIDFKHKIIPDEITLYGMLIGLVCSFLMPELQGEVDRRLAIANSILGLLCGGGIIYILAVLGELVFRKEAMGGGDVKLLAMIGAFIGVRCTMIGFLISPYFAIIFALYYKFVKKEATIPYGPFLSLGAITAIFFGDYLMSLLGF